MLILSKDFNNKTELGTGQRKLNNLSPARAVTAVIEKHALADPSLVVWLPAWNSNDPITIQKRRFARVFSCCTVSRHTCALPEKCHASAMFRKAYKYSHRQQNKLKIGGKKKPWSFGVKREGFWRTGEKSRCVTLRTQITDAGRLGEARIAPKRRNLGTWSATTTTNKKKLFFDG